MKSKHLHLNRRRALQIAVTASLSAGALCCGPVSVNAEELVSGQHKPWLRKTLKFGMIGVDGDLNDKFAAAKQAGFEGVELNAPGFDRHSVKQATNAAKATGLIIDGTVGSDHWQVRHTDPDPAVRAKALASLRQGLQQTADVGADTMLLVAGHGKDGSPSEVDKRALDNISQAVPNAEELGVSILIENVWNEFLYDPNGGTSQTADALAAFIDDFNSPFVGLQFDIGNHWKYGDPAEWIRTLGQRIKKLDIKGFSRKTGRFTKITEGDIDWPTVKEALRDIDYTGWLAAEVSGGNVDRLREISQHLDEALQCNVGTKG
ncbi:fructoselysine 3-epimerase [Planctomycetes bacterium CA13]|uniref:Fructoselysine 3-epimerase n=1 Tax=Novipirellula herctigrandis TaxID=2527986 RepID=A0A5C5ZDE4_9BACT|nr:fructoselysine 3-epimerase [Planctomycetes bacterium CA13]